MVRVNELGGNANFDGNKNGPVKKQENEGKTSIFNNYDKSQDKKIDIEEMGIEKALNKVLDRLPDSAKSGAAAGVINKIRGIVEEMGKDISYDPTNYESLDAATAEVNKRISDAEKLENLVKELNKNENNAKEFNVTSFASSAAMKVLDEGHNTNIANAQNEKVLHEELDRTLDTLVKSFVEKSKNGENVNHEDLIVQTLRGLGFENVDVSNVYKGKEVKNDERTEAGILRGADKTRIKVSYTYNGETKEVTRNIDFVSKDAQKGISEEKVEFTKDQNSVLEWDDGTSEKLYDGKFVE